MCAAFKNVLAIGCGIIDGLHAGVNTKAVLITQGLEEMGLLIDKLDVPRISIRALSPAIPPDGFTETPGSRAAIASDARSVTWSRRLPSLDSISFRNGVP